MARNLLKTALVFAALTIPGCSANRQIDDSTVRVFGAKFSLGKGTVSSYAALAKDGTPEAIGIVLQAGALEGLPADDSDAQECHDQKNDEQLDVKGECLATHEWVIPLPGKVVWRSEIPFKWVGLIWNPHGHAPEGVYELPHFDVRFSLEPIENIFGIGLRPCGPEHVRCAQIKLATKSLPPSYMHADFKNANAVVPAMGNRLIDASSPEFNGKKFTQTWVYGADDGHATFYETMVTREYLLSRPTGCFPLKLPPAVGVSGYYPTRYCIRYDARAGEYTVSLEDLVKRKASAPEAPR